MEFVELNASNVAKEVLLEFDSGNQDITDYLHNQADRDSIEGNGVTYVLVDEDRARIYAYATIAAHGLYYYDDAEKYHTVPMTNDGRVLLAIPCVEIKMFAISRKLRGQIAFKMDPEKQRRYSALFFNMLLEKLYYMSMDTIGFKLIFLRANNEGERLYREAGFVDASDKYEATYNAKAENCVPLILPLSGIEELIFSEYM